VVAVEASGDFDAQNKTVLGTHQRAAAVAAHCVAGCPSSDVAASGSMAKNLAQSWVAHTRIPGVVKVVVVVLEGIDVRKMPTTVSRLQDEKQKHLAGQHLAATTVPDCVVHAAMQVASDEGEDVFEVVHCGEGEAEATLVAGGRDGVCGAVSFNSKDALALVLLHRHQVPADLELLLLVDAEVTGLDVAASLSATTFSKSDWDFDAVSVGSGTKAQTLCTKAWGLDHVAAIAALCKSD